MVPLVWQAVDAEGDEVVEHFLAIGDRSMCTHTTSIMRMQRAALTVPSMHSWTQALEAKSLGKSPSQLGMEGSAFANTNLS